MNLRKPTIYFFTIILVSIFIMASVKAEQITVKDSRSYPQAVHPVTRQTARPSGDTVVDVNPPSLLWPSVKGLDIRYRVHLSQNQYFSTNNAS